MFRTLANSWRLFRATLDVLSYDKELLVFPIVSGVSCALLLASFAAGMWGSGLLPELTGQEPASQEARWAAAAVGVAFYFVNTFVITYFNAALVGAAVIRLQGGDPRVADGFAAANRCLGAILGYSLIAATVGLLLRALQRNQKNPIARIVVGLIGMAWSLVTYLVIPVLVVERIGPIDGLRRSAALLRKTWGEQIAANFGLGALGFLLALLGVLILAPGVALAGALGQPVWGIGAFAIALAYWLGLSVVLSALGGIYTAALYEYASDRPVSGLAGEFMTEAFSQR